MVAEGRFRMDLYYRLRVVSIEVPPLRERGGDVELLAGHFLHSFAEYYSKGTMSFTPEAMALLREAPWEGNVRELRNLVESLVVLARGGTVNVTDLPPSYRTPRVQAWVEEAAAVGPNGQKTMRDIERDAILGALRETGGNRDKAARKLSIGLRTLQRKIKEYRDQGVDV